jgi:hypothetical protein
MSLFFSIRGLQTSTTHPALRGVQVQRLLSPTDVPRVLIVPFFPKSTAGQVLLELDPGGKRHFLGGYLSDLEVSGE